MSVTLEIERAIRIRCDWMRVLLLPEAPIRLQLGPKTIGQGALAYTYNAVTDYMADFVSVSEAGYVTELEVKVSRADWLADLQKPKWSVGFPPYICKFIYVVPKELGIPEWVPPAAGVWHWRLVGHRDDPNTYIEVARQPRRIGREKVPDAVLEKWRAAFYYRFWRLRQDLDHRIERKRLRMGADRAQARCFC